MAGMPASLIDRANEILSQLETKHVDDETEIVAGGDISRPKPLENKIKQLSLPKMQLSIFDAHSETFDEIRKLLEDLDINRLTPVEALLKLQEIKSKLK
jgi:DNA mismatch repair protein MutS